MGCDDGKIACYQLVFSTVHGLHKDSYAYRESMTDVCVQQLLQDTQTEIHCNDLVKKVAIYKNKLAVQLSDKIVVYETSGSDKNMTYKVREQILENLECSLLVVCSKNVILCQEKRLQCYDFQGLREREWHMDALIRYIKVIGGPLGEEGLLLGLKNGQVLKIFITNPFPIELMRIKGAIRCLDISLKRTKLAVVDEQSTCQVYDLKTKSLMYQEPNANSVAWNSLSDDLLCFSGNGQLGIKARDFSVYRQFLEGFVVGFVGSKVFCLHLYSMSTIEVPLSNQVYQFIERGLFKEAYQIACLGVPEGDWQLLGTEALEALQLSIAKRAFIRARNLKFLELINTIEERRLRGESEKTVFLAEIKAYQGQLDDAARLYQEVGQDEKALELYTDLRLFDRAQRVLASSSSMTQKQLIRKRADWAANTNEPRVAAEMYISAGDYHSALTIILQNGWTDMLHQLVRRVDRTETELLGRAADYFIRCKAYDLAAEVYAKVNDVRALLKMHLEAKQWTEVFRLVDENPQYQEEAYVQYANWLAEQDQFENAQKAFHKAGKDDEAMYVLEQLTRNAYRECRFNSAAYYYWMLSHQHLDKAKIETEKETECLNKFLDYQKTASLYYAYSAIHKYTTEPFTSYQPEALVNIGRFIMNELGEEKLPGVSRPKVLYTLAKQGRTLGAYKLAKFAFEKLQTLRVPVRMQQFVDLGSLTIRAKPFHDAEELLPMCYRCSTTNPLLNPKGNICVHCAHPFQFSFVSFEVLPLVEFAIEPGIADSDAKDLIAAEPPLDSESAGSSAKSALSSRPTAPVTTYKPPVMQRSDLVSMQPTEVIVFDWPPPARCRYFLNVIPDISVYICPSCNRTFHTDDYVMHALQDGKCPFCNKEDSRSSDDDDTLDI